MCVCVYAAQPTGFGKLAFYARIQRADAKGVGGGKLIAHSCVEGVRWAPEVLDKVQGLVYTKPAIGSIRRT